MPQVNQGLYSLVKQTYALLKNVYDYGATSRGAILSDLPYIEKIDRKLNQVVSVLMDAISTEVRDVAHDTVNGIGSTKNSLKFADDERE